MSPLFWPVAQATKLDLPLNSRPPEELREKPEVPALPASHWNWVVSAVGDIDEPLMVIRDGGDLTSHNAATALAVGDHSARQAELGGREAVVTNTDLSIVKLAQRAGDITRGSEVEAAAVTATSEGVGADGQRCNCNEALHCSGGMQLLDERERDSR